MCLLLRLSVGINLVYKIEEIVRSEIDRESEGFLLGILKFAVSGEIVN